MSTRAPADASDVKLWTVVVAVVLAAAPIGGADAAFDALDGTAAGTQRAQRMNNATTTSPPPAPPPSVFSATAEEMLDLVNQQRTSRGLAPMRLNAQLNSAAQAHTVSQSAAGDIFHEGLDGSSPGDRIARTGYRFSTWGENVAAGYRTPASVMAAWMQSPGHCRNLLNPGFTELGVGYVKLTSDPSRFYDYWTQNFARPSGEPAPAGTYNPAWC